ncbi:MAG: cyclic beta 1-2 glucan synthetase [Candidatus Omnitrophota bacterium]|jgi:cellobiose phosphorylase|nr:MAG: cyclic beta 1-2 glucan synthetase [Candidatus Omnitrophota bacterium]
MEQIRATRHHLPKGYSRELPVLINGNSAEFPRVYDMALELISHIDGKIDVENLSCFVSAYQTVNTLKLGELWAIPIMLRLALIENLRRIAVCISSDRLVRENSTLWADQLVQMAETDPKNIILVIADMARSNPPMTCSFVAELVHRLQGQGTALAIPLTWIEQRLSEQNTTIAQMVQQENQQQATDQVSIGNSIGSLRFLVSLDWREFVETRSAVENTLRCDPMNEYNDMDFATRDRYRHVVEKIAKRSSFAETEVAQKAIALAQKGVDANGRKHRSAHVGYYLIDKGLPHLEKAVNARVPSREHFQRIIHHYSLLSYLGMILFFTSIFAMLILLPVNRYGVSGWPLILSVILIVLCVNHLAIALVNWLASLFLSPHVLPRLDYSKGIPSELCTLVVIPTIIAQSQNIQDLLERLEIHYLANRDCNLLFGLLTDFRDAPHETMPDDDKWLRQTREGITALNKKYCQEGMNQFCLFHRPRRWNVQEQVWMGYERKRGKLTELNSLLRGKSQDRFSVIIGDSKSLQRVKYVITLDTDTQLPRDSARQLVGTIAHSLNRPWYDPQKRRVVDGYCILQPRVAVSLPEASRSLYSKIFAGDTGIDPYTREVSDVYQDIFHEGSFIGKGIYDVNTFDQILEGRFPENRILSHDLIEGCFVRSSLVSDISLFEEHPTRYNTEVSRRHRWIRGDWQIAVWLLPRVPGSDARRRKNPLSGLSRWKIFDNLRRSLVSPALLLLLLFGWTVLKPAWLWNTIVLGVIFIPPLLSSVRDLFKKTKDIPLFMHVRNTARTLKRNFLQESLSIVFLPYDAYNSIDAISRTIVRLSLTHRRLLEWATAGESEQSHRMDFIGFYKSMWFSPAMAVTVAVCLSVWGSFTILPHAGLFLMCWIVSPLVAWWISRPIPKHEIKLAEDQIVFLRKITRRIWRYYETFVSQEDHWLPPDNFQEYPASVVAHRTSPTNIGLSLLANMTACDFGYISSGQLIERTKNTFATLNEMKRFQGHFFNWYDTQSLKPLMPQYVSTVDSGNFVGHVLCLRSGIHELLHQKILSERMHKGMIDSLNILVDVIQEGIAHNTANQRNPAFSDILVIVNRMQKELLSGSSTVLETQKLLSSISAALEEVVNGLGNNLDAETEWWITACQRQSRDFQDEIAVFFPWLSTPKPINHLWNQSPSELTNGKMEIRNAINRIENDPTVKNLVEMKHTVLPILDNILDHWHNSEPDAFDEEWNWYKQFRNHIQNSCDHATERMNTIHELTALCHKFSEIEYDFLFDKSCNLLSIGYNTTTHQRDAGFYDLLASESRLISFIGIAQGYLPQEHWFALGRLLTISNGELLLLSWSGSMFEYLMPLLIMPTYENTLLDQTCKAVVKKQIEYGKQRGVPWGISESGYNATDVNLNYQYRTFGVPGLGFKRELAQDLVIAPYATIMALMVDPLKAYANLQRLVKEGMAGKYGFYEAIDYTPSRQIRNQSQSVVRSFMAHHNGMSILSLSYLLLDQPMQKRFGMEPMFQAADLLLQERIPKTAPSYPYLSEFSNTRSIDGGQETLMRVFRNPNTAIPEVHMLSNGRYHVMITNAGCGYSRWKDTDVTRWSEDPTCDNGGIFCYIRDVVSGDIWSAGYQPTLKKPERYEAIFPQARAEFRRHDFGIDTHMEIAVSPEDDIELRRISITNRSQRCRIIEITSYAEVVLASTMADAMHPAFSKLFVQTELIRHRQGILSTRRPRSLNEPTPWMLHSIAVHGTAIDVASYETDRMKFIGRGKTLVNPLAMDDTAKLSGAEGSVLDPIVSIRCRISIEPGETIRVDLISGIAETRDSALGLMEKYHDQHLADRIIDLAWTHAQIVLSHLNATEADAQTYGRLASSVLFANASKRANPSVLKENRRCQSGLWGYGISGDLPIVLLLIGDQSKIELVRQLVNTYTYWRAKGLMVDLLICNEDRSGYRDLLHNQIMELMASGAVSHEEERPGGIFIRHTDQMPEEDRILMQSVARIIITDIDDNLANQVEKRERVSSSGPKFTPVLRRQTWRENVRELPHRELIFNNGLGGFTLDGREYVIQLNPKQSTPMPWVNVLANPYFGSVVSESGGAYTWSENAHEFRLTPWYNDPVTDTSGEAFYIRDEESGKFWSPTPLPARGNTPYVTRHGFGYSVYEHSEQGIYSELWVYVDMEVPIKFMVLKVQNHSGQPRKLSTTGYFEFVLGDLRSKTRMHVITEVDSMTGSIFAYNHYNADFANRVVFLNVSEFDRTVTGDRMEFIGRNGTLANPVSMEKLHLSGKVGAALDPCAAMQIPFELVDGQEREIVFILGAGHTIDEARNLAIRFRTPHMARQSLESVWKYWNLALGVIHIETPDPAINIISNGWLMYQNLASRFWARSGYYQSGGAFGYRDQLQDGMALIYCKPALTREHLLRCAAHQFREGDVQHWWHQPTNRGVRTNISDDYLWLPFATCHYVSCTGDTGVLDERSFFLEGRPVKPEEEAYYDSPAKSEEEGSLYDHCVRAIKRGMNYGEHGLPLIGSGDWNDGMNLVGKKGRGESVWLGFFLYNVLMQFSQVARMRNDLSFADLCVSEANKLQQDIERNTWDGQWYRRAYFDNGEQLGSSANPECQIDSLPQSWSILSGAGDPERSRQAMDSLDSRLVRRGDSLIQLLDPPFDKSHLNPGYIKGYVPGVRENGGQYTHAAVWTVMAFAAMKDSRRAWELMSLINPVNHGSTSEQIHTYKVEPYVTTSDVYAVPPHTGRGGWTWYTGSAGWMYRLIVESLLGLRLDADRLRFDPCLPTDWKSFKIHFRFGETFYHMVILQTGHNQTVTRILVDGIDQDDKTIHLKDDQRNHSVEVEVT